MNRLAAGGCSILEELLMPASSLQVAEESSGCPLKSRMYSLVVNQQVQLNCLRRVNNALLQSHAALWASLQHHGLALPAHVCAVQLLQQPAKAGSFSYLLLDASVSRILVEQAADAVVSLVAASRTCMRGILSGVSGTASGVAWPVFHRDRHLARPHEFQQVPEDMPSFHRHEGVPLRPRRMDEALPKFQEDHAPDIPPAPKLAMPDVMLLRDSPEEGTLGELEGSEDSQQGVARPYLQETLWMKLGEKLRLGRIASSGSRALLDDIWYYDGTADMLAGAMGRISLQHFMAVSRGARECMREAHRRLRGPVRRVRCQQKPPSPHPPEATPEVAPARGKHFLQVWRPPVDALVLRCLGQAFRGERWPWRRLSRLCHKMHLAITRHNCQVKRNAKCSALAHGADGDQHRWRTSVEEWRKEKRRWMERLIDKRVELDGLDSRPHLNGTTGTLVKVNLGSGCWTVLTDGTRQKVKVPPASLRLLDWGDLPVWPEELGPGPSAKLLKHRPRKASKGDTVPLSGDEQVRTSIGLGDEGRGAEGDSRSQLTALEAIGKSLRVRGFLGEPTACALGLAVESHERCAEHLRQLDKKRRRWQQSDATPADCRIILCGGSTHGFRSLSSVECFLPAEGRWEALPPMNARRFSPAVAIANGYLYVCGGSDRASRFSAAVPLKSTERFDLATGVWHRLPDASVKRFAAASALCRQRLWICGGYAEKHAVSDVECLNLQTETWEVMPSLHQRRYDFRLEVLLGRLYALGGTNESGVLSDVETVDTLTGASEDLPPMIEKRFEFATGLILPWLYICGGFDGTQALRSVERLDPVNRRWEPVQPMIHRRLGASFGVIGRRLIVAGGATESSVLSSAELYNPQANAWEALPPLKHSRRDGSAVVVGTRLYVMGGCDRKSKKEGGLQVLSSAECFNPSAWEWEELPEMCTERFNMGCAKLEGS